MAELIYSKFGGTICRQGSGYYVRFRDEQYGNRFYKSFLLKDFKNLDVAKEAAEEYQQVTSDFNGLSIQIWPSDLPEKVKEWCAAFIDGDGSIGVYGLKGKSQYPRVCAGQAQANGKIPEVLLFLQRCYGGDFTSRLFSRDDPRRTLYEWYIGGPNALVAIYDVAKHAILKKHQAQLIIDFVKRHNSTDCRLIRPELDKLHSLKSYQATEIDATAITSAKCGGLFNAEGCITIRSDSALGICFAQKSSPEYLNAINNFYEMKGKVQDDALLIFCGQNAENVLVDILPYLMGPKRVQAELAIEARQVTKIYYTKRTPAQLSRLAEIRQQVTALKHI